MTDTGQPSLLSRLSAEDLDALCARASSRRYTRDEVIISHQDERRDIYLVRAGRARVTIFSQQGRAVDYRDIGPGEIFGEMSAIDRAPRSASVVAVEDVEAFCLSEAEFHRLLDERPGIARAIMAHLTFQLRRMTERVLELSTLRVRDRLILELLRLSEGGQQDHHEIRPAPTHHELAARLGTHREAVSREMSHLAKQGLVKKREGTLILGDREALRALLANVAGE